MLYDGGPTRYSYYVYNGNELNPLTISDSNKDIYFESVFNNTATYKDYTKIEKEKYGCDFGTSSDNYKCIMKFLNKSADYLKDTGSTLIVVGYDITKYDDKGNVISDKNLKNFSSADSEFCSGSDYEGYCYYDATSNGTELNDLFANLVYKIIEANSNADNVILRLKPISIETEEGTINLIEFENSNENGEIEIKLNVEEDGKISLDNANYKFEITQEFFDYCNEHSEVEYCSGQQSLFDITMDLFNGETKIETLDVDDLNFDIIISKIKTLN